TTGPHNHATNQLMHALTPPEHANRDQVIRTLVHELEEWRSLGWDHLPFSLTSRRRLADDLYVKLSEISEETAVDTNSLAALLVKAALAAKRSTQNGHSKTLESVLNEWAQAASASGLPIESVAASEGAIDRQNAEEVGQMLVLLDSQPREVSIELVLRLLDMPDRTRVEITRALLASDEPFEKNMGTLENWRRSFRSFTEYRQASMSMRAAREAGQQGTNLFEFIRTGGANEW
ncbi:MAG: hypothetical protein AAFQ82_16265, partial [Myxococcota bacterium]